MSGFEGMRGNQGLRGFGGQRGEPGVQGQVGPKGVTGLKGEKGETDLLESASLGCVLWRLRLTAILTFSLSHNHN